MKEYPNVQTIDSRPGDEGKDSFLGTLICEAGSIMAKTLGALTK